MADITARKVMTTRYVIDLADDEYSMLTYTLKFTKGSLPDPYRSFVERLCENMQESTPVREEKQDG